eukprot:8148469-Lingulodinium_polyedra.AAC.1
MRRSLSWTPPMSCRVAGTCSASHSRWASLRQWPNQDGSARSQSMLRPLAKAKRWKVGQPQPSCATDSRKRATGPCGPPSRPAEKAQTTA